MTTSPALTPEQFDVVYEALEGEVYDEAMDAPCGVTMETEWGEIQLAPSDLASENVAQMLQRLVTEAVPLADGVQRTKYGSYLVPHSTNRGASLVAVAEKWGALRCASPGCANPDACVHVVAVWVRRARQKAPA